MPDRIYLDYNATTPCDPRVVDAMLPYFTERFGNPASRTHAFGWEALEAVERARGQVAALLGATPREITFTSGATEANNLALKGAACALRRRGNHILTVATEHKAVLDPCAALERMGEFEVTRLPVDRHGRVDCEQLLANLRKTTILVSVMLANNETGVLQPVAEIGAACRERDILFHTDATQAVGKMPVDVGALSVDLLSLSGHKLYGPKGIGVLYRRRGGHVRLVPQMDGGGHEGGLRSGTLNVPAIVGLGEACAICQETLSTESERLRTLRDQLRDALFAQVDGLCENGHPTLRLGQTLNVSVANVEGEMLITSLDRIAVSSGSACTSALPTPSHVLAAMGVSPELAHASIRFSVGRFTTEEEIDRAATHFAQTVKRLRS